MHSFTAPARKPAVHRLAANGLVKARAHLARRVAPRGPAALCVLAFALMTAGVTTASAQESGGGTIMIAGPAETNPADVVTMAKNAGMTVDANASQPASPAQPVKPQPARPVGYAAAAHAADAAMRAAALALDAHADAADASSS